LPLAVPIGTRELTEPKEKCIAYNCSDRSGGDIADVYPARHNIFWNSIKATIKELVEFGRGLVQ
jgi:hypothetical protein